MNKRSLEHDNTWFGRRFCCLVIYATVSDGYLFSLVIRTWQNIVWMAFLFLGVFCYSSQNARINLAWKDQTDLGNRGNDQKKMAQSTVETNT